MLSIATTAWVEPADRRS